MFDTHESVAVRNAGELIEKELVYFNDAIGACLGNLDDQKHTPWFSLLSKSYQFWEAKEILNCYQYILDNHWNVEAIKPPIELMESYCHAGDEVGLRDWCESDSRHMSYKEAVEWAETDECGNAISVYLKEGAALVPNPTLDEDIFDPFKEPTPTYISQFEFEAGYTESEYDFNAGWNRMVEQILYVDRVEPTVTTEAKIKLLNIALISQPISCIIGKKNQYIAAIKRVQALNDTLKHE